MPDTTDDLIAGLRRWTESHDAHVRAAVELLIEHEFWLRRQDFLETCVRTHGSGDARTDAILWRGAREFADEGPLASSSQLAILDLAVALGEDRYKLAIMGHVHARWIASAVADAVGVRNV